MILSDANLLHNATFLHASYFDMVEFGYPVEELSSTFWISRVNDRKISEECKLKR